MQVFVEAINFNHDPLSGKADAINIRLNEFESVPNPEWQRGDTNGPAAYAISETLGNKITIKAKFSCVPRVSTLEIRAIDPNYTPSSGIEEFVDDLFSLISPRAKAPTTNVLGSVKARHVIFDENGVSAIQTFELENVNLRDAGVNANTVTWLWQYRSRGRDRWITFETTRHRIYTILRLPSGPWTREPLADNNTQLPWSEVLEFACTWAAGSRNVDEAASRITREVRLLETTLDVAWDPCPAYTDDSSFDCSNFLNLIRGGAGKGLKLNCTDLASVVSTFANVVGCSLWQSTMSGGASFFTNPIRLLGDTTFQSVQFAIHEVAWKGACTENEEVFDACVLVDGDDDPVNAPHIPKLPANLRFGQPDEKGYLFRLAAPLGSHPGSILPHPVPLHRQRRSLGPVESGCRRAFSFETLRFFKARYGYDEWRRRISRELFIGGFFLSKQSFRDWKFVGIPRVIRVSQWPPTIQALVQTTLPDVIQNLRVDVDVCVSAESAVYFLLRRAARFETPTLVMRPDLEIGDIALMESQTGTILFARGNIVVSVRNPLNTFVNPADLAKLLDRYLTEHPDREGKESGLLQRFYPATTTVTTDEEIPLLIQSDSIRESQQFYKFFCTSGYVRQRRGEFVYCSTGSGSHQLTVFAYDADGTILSQQLEIDVKASA